MNIAFCKIGKSIKFKSKYSSIGGDNEAPALLMALANNNPSITFYIVGRSDFDRLDCIEKQKLFPYENVRYCLTNHKPTPGLDKTEESEKYLVRYFEQNNIKIDCGIMMMGAFGQVTIPNKILKLDGSGEYASVIELTKNYATPIIGWLNHTNIPWIEIINDPNYTKAQARDFISGPFCSLSQFDYKYKTNQIKSIDDQTRIESSQDVEYTGMETAFCVDKDYPNIVDKKNKPHCFNIVLNQSKHSRYKKLKEWVLDWFVDVNIYGKWDQTIIDNDDRFRGPRYISDIQQIMSQTRYTFIIPIRDGWVTSKYIEMIHAGCIPFFHPQYDTQHHIDVLDILRPNSPQEMKQTIEGLNSDSELRYAVLNELQKILKPQYYDGTFLNQTIMERISQHLHQRSYIAETLPEVINKYPTLF